MNIIKSFITITFLHWNLGNNVMWAVINDYENVTYEVRIGQKLVNCFRSYLLMKMANFAVITFLNKDLFLWCKQVNV